MIYGNRGRVRARDPDTHRQFECRRLGANAIHYRNTRYIALALQQLHQHGLELPDSELAGVHNAHHEHINMFGWHDINTRTEPRKGNHRPLRPPPDLKALTRNTAN